MRNIKPTKLDVALVKQSFKIVDGVLYRKFRGVSWRLVKQLDIMEYNQLSFNNTKQSNHKIVMILKLGGNIPDGYVVDHIDANKYNNHIDNLQLLNRRDNIGKDLLYCKSRLIQVKFQIDGYSMNVGVFPKESDRELIWNAMAKYVLFRQGLNQSTRDHLLKFIDRGDIKAARTIFKKLVHFELAKIKLGV